MPFLIILLAACDFNPNDKVVPEWEMEILGPLVKADLTIQNISQLEDLHASATLKLSDFNINTAIVPNNSAAPVNIGTFPNILDITNAFAKGKFESGDLYFKITNQWQINIRQNTRFILKTGAGVLYDHALTTTIPANNGVYTSPVTSLAGDSINTSAISLEVQQFSTNGGSITDANRNLTIEIFLENVKIGSIEVTTGENFSSIIDTSDFSINGSTIQSESVSGVFNAFVTNNFPVNFQLQVYFLDASKSIIRDSLFTGFHTFISQGGEQKIPIPLNATKIHNLNNSQFARIVWKANVNSTVQIPNSLYLKMQLVGDLKVKLDEQ